MAKHAKKKRVLHPPPRAAAAAPTVVSAEAERRLGLAAFERAAYGEAIQAWQRVQRARPSPSLDRALAEAHFRRALGSTNPPRRVAELQEAIALAPDRATYQFHLGLAYHRQGQLRRAVAPYEEALRLAPADERVRRHLALALLADPATSARGRDALAQPSASVPKVGEAMVRLRALADLRQSDSAAALTRLSALTSPSPLANLALGLASLVAGRTEPARVALTKVKRTRQSVSDEARQATALGIAATYLRDRRLDEVLKTVRGLDVPGEPNLRRAFTALLRRLGVELVLDDRLADAVDVWQNALAAQPGHEPTQQGLGHVQDVAGTRAVRDGHFAQAIQYWEGALTGRTGDPRLLRNLALAEERLELWNEASAHWEELIRQWKKPARAGADDDARQRLGVAQRHLAGSHEAAGNYHAAARALERALAADPTDVDLRLRAAELYLGNEEYGPAIEQLRRVRDARPNDTRVLLDLGSAYDFKGDDRQAQGYLEQALALEPDNHAVRSTLASIHHGRAHRLTDQRQGERGIADFERAIELLPTDSSHQECLGALLLQLSRPDEAEPILRRALALNPGDAQSRIRIAGIYLTYGQTTKAERLLKEAIRLDKSAATRAGIGVLYAARGELDKALTHFKHVLKNGGPELLVMIGDILIANQRMEDAIPYLERAIQLDPWNVAAHLSLAYSYAAGRHDHDRAADEIARAEVLDEASGTRAHRKLIEMARSINELMAEEVGLSSPGRQAR